MPRVIRFQRLIARDFGPFGSIDVRLDGRGLCLVRGDNRDTSAADSNGSGKTHLFKALAWCLYGKTIPADRPSKLVRVGAKDCEVAVQLTDGGLEAWTVVRTAPKPSLRFSMWSKSTTGIGLDEVDLTGPTIAATEQAIAQFLGLDFNTFTNSVYYAQGVLTRFSDPETTDGERKSVLKRILQLERFDRAMDAAKADVTRAATERAKADAAHTTAQTAAKNAQESIDELLSQLAAKQDERKALAGRLKKLPRLRKLLADVDTVLRDMVVVREQITQKESEVSDLASQLRVERATLVSLKTAAATAKSEYNKTQWGSECPTCGASVTLKIESVRNERMEALRDAEEAVSACQARFSATDKAKLSTEQATDELREQVKDYREWSERRDGFRLEIAALSEVEKAESGLRDEEDQLAMKVRKKQSLLTEATDGMAAARISVAAAERWRAHAEFWVRGFGNAGLPSLILDEVLPDLTARANHYLGILTDGGISIAFDTETTLASGAVRDKFAINLTVEGFAGVTPSGGQARKVSIAVDLALMDLLAARERSAVDLLLLDEVLDGLDAVGKSRVIDLLVELRKRRSSIFVISHDPEIKEVFEHSITVIKEDGRARLEET